MTTDIVSEGLSEKKTSYSTRAWGGDKAVLRSGYCLRQAQCQDSTMASVLPARQCLKGSSTPNAWGSQGFLLNLKPKKCEILLPGLGLNGDLIVPSPRRFDCAYSGRGQNSTALFSRLSPAPPPSPQLQDMLFGQNVAFLQESQAARQISS